MSKHWLAPSITLLVSVLLFGEFSHAYTEQVQQTPETSHPDAEIIARPRYSDIFRRRQNLPNLNIRIKPDRLRHSFDGHAIQWFGRKVPATPENLRIWQGLIEQASRSKLRLRDFRDGHETIVYLARVGNRRWFVAHFFANGPRTGELATAFFPNQKQIKRMLDLLQ